MTVSLAIALHNVTQEVEVLNVLHEYTARTVVPETLLESFLFGACTAGIFIGSFLLWSRSSHSTQPSRISAALLMWSLYGLLVTHWVLNLRQLLQLLSGSAIGLTLTDMAVYNDARALEEQYGNDTERWVALVPASIFTGFASAWQYLIPLVTETTLLGFSTVLLLPVLHTALRQKGGHQPWRSSAWVIPAVTTVMYAISLSHWAASISLYNESIVAAVNPLQSGSYIGTGYIGINSSVALLTSACLAVNIALSDAIVLWRMYIVWDRARFTVALSAALVSTTSALAIANLVGLAGVVSNSTGNLLDSEVLPTFGDNSIGLAAAFMSLASNVCATVLVGLKAWLLRKELARRGPSSSSQRTTIERVMELLIDSGVAYTAIWLLYLISFFRTVTAYGPVQEDEDTPYEPITAVAHLDAAMAQLTTIYPLIILLLIGINKAHYAREPRLLREQNSTFALTINIDPDMDMEGGKMLDPEANGRLQPGEGDTKLIGRDSKDVW